MPCPECIENHQRAVRAEAAEESLLVFTEMVSNLGRQLWELEAEADRRRKAAFPLSGVAPIPKQRFLLVTADRMAGKPAVDPKSAPAMRI